MKRDRQDNFQRRNPKGRSRPSSGLPDTATLVVTHRDEKGMIIAVPEIWNHRQKPPYIIVNAPAISIEEGARIMARLQRQGAHRYLAQYIRLLPAQELKKLVGIFVPGKSGGGMIESVSRKSRESHYVLPADVNGAQAGELVSAGLKPSGDRRGGETAIVEERLGSLQSPHAASLIAAHMHKLPMQFSAAVLEDAERAVSPVAEPSREDLRPLPLVTIDGEDARDFDDAVFAEPDENPSNKGGFHLIVAIADVAHYVKEGSELDKQAFERGNSVYFPDRVIPMLPERLSNGLCSLKPDEDRYALAVHLWIDAQGVTRRYRFTRAIMRSKARLTYNQLEEALSGKGPGHKADALIRNLSAAYEALARERDARGTLAINLPEYKVQFDDAGNVAQIVARVQLESHRLIEAFMVAANVAAADYLLKHKAAGIFRVHEPPSEDKITDLRKFLGLSGYVLPRGTVTPSVLNRILIQAEKRPDTMLVHTVILRSQMQAFYSPNNVGHFGLALEHYCHFTSPIRRYSDLIVHRSLTALLSKLPEKIAPENLAAVALHISQTERTAMAAERDAMDRYKIFYMVRHVGEGFTGLVTSLNEYGLYVILPDKGVTGFVPVSQMGQDFFIYNKAMACFQSRNGKTRFHLGDKVAVRVAEADIMRSSLIFKIERNISPPKKPGHTSNRSKR